MIFAQNDTVSINFFTFFTDKKSLFSTPKMILHKIKSAHEKSFVFEKALEKIFHLSLIFCVLVKKINSMKCSDKM